MKEKNPKKGLTRAKDKLIVNIKTVNEYERITINILYEVKQSLSKGEIEETISYRL